MIFVSPHIKKWANLQLPLNVLKLQMFQLQGGFASLTPDQSFGHLPIASLILFHYLVIYCTISDICVIGYCFDKVREIVIP